MNSTQCSPHGLKELWYSGVLLEHFIIEPIGAMVSYFLGKQVLFFFNFYSAIWKFWGEHSNYQTET